MKKNKKTTFIILLSVLVVIGIVGIFVFNNLKTAKYIENIAEKMHNAEEIENFKIKIEETALYEGRDYSKIETNTYDLKNKIINFDVTKTEYACFEEDCETIEKTTKEYRTFDGTYETSVSDWYDFNPESNFTDVKITTEIYDINNSEITIPEDIINNAVQKEY